MCEIIKVQDDIESNPTYTKEYGSQRLKTYQVVIFRTQYHVLNFTVKAPDSDEAYEITQEVRTESDDWYWKNEDNDYQITECEGVEEA